MRGRTDNNVCCDMMHGCTLHSSYGFYTKLCAITDNTQLQYDKPHICMWMNAPVTVLYKTVCNN